MITRPILFSGAMVRALLDGSKTQTRRVLKVRCQEIGERDDGSRWPWSENPNTAGDHWHACPYGQPGDRLWVRETWVCDDYRLQQGPYVEVPGAREELFYRADNEQPFEAPECKFWKPSIHMPRWASRILLEIISVRVERLQDITEGDAWAEGVDKAEVLSMPCADGAAAAYSALWQRINGPGSWEANPWVWVVEFKRVTP